MPHPTEKNFTVPECTAPLTICLPKMTICTKSIYTSRKNCYPFHQEVKIPLKVEINIDPACPDPKITIHTDRITPEIESLLTFLSAPSPDTLPVHSDRGVELIPIESILRVYSQRQKVFVQNAAGTYTVRQRLYEMEKRLEGRSFVRISSSELVNTRMITGMDFSLAGTIMISLKGGVTTYVSRRHVSEIKKMFDL